jgi:hypothetical protein
MTTDTTVTVAYLDTMLIAVIPTGEDIEAAIKAEEENANVSFDRDEIEICNEAKHVADVANYNSRDWVFWERDRSGYVRASALEIEE